MAAGDDTNQNSNNDVQKPAFDRTKSIVTNVGGAIVKNGLIGAAVGAVALGVGVLALGALSAMAVPFAAPVLATLGFANGIPATLGAIGSAMLPVLGIGAAAGGLIGAGLGGTIAATNAGAAADEDEERQKIKAQNTAMLEHRMKALTIKNRMQEMQMQKQLAAINGENPNRSLPNMRDGQSATIG